MKIDLKNKKIGVLLFFSGLYISILALSLKQVVRSQYDLVVIFFDTAFGFEQILAFSLFITFLGLYITVFYDDRKLNSFYSSFRRRIFDKENESKKRRKTSMLITVIVLIIIISIFGYYYSLQNINRPYSMLESIFLGFIDNFMKIIGISFFIGGLGYLIKTKINK